MLFFSFSLLIYILFLIGEKKDLALRSVLVSNFRLREHEVKGTCAKKLTTSTKKLI